MIRINLVILLLSFNISLVTAQETNVPPPVAPYLAKLQNDSSWQITYTRSSAPSSEAAKAPDKPPATLIKSINIMRNNGVRREQILLTDNTSTEKWIAQGSIFTQQKTGSPFFISSAALMGIASNDGVYPDFPDLVWLDISYFKSVEIKNGQKCYVYFVPKSLHDEFTPIDSPLPTEPTRVWVNIDTKRPVAVETESCQSVYAYDLPVASLTLPLECQKFFKQANVVRQRLSGQTGQRP